MKKKTTLTAILGVALLFINQSACTAKTPTPAPTVDLNPLRTEVAATVFAQVTQSLVPTPPITPSPTPTVTAINLPTFTPTQNNITTPNGTALATTPAAKTPLPGFPSPTLEDRAQWVSQTILDGSTFLPGETFTMTWQLENVGRSTWLPGYLLRFYSGDPFGAIKEIPLGREVPPGQTIEITVLMKAPIKTGDYRSDWVLSTQSRSNFKEPVFLKITVATPTPTPTRAPGTPIPPAT